MSKSSNNKTVLVAPGMSVGEAVRSAGMMSATVFAAARRAADTRPKYRPRNAGCPTYSIESVSLLRRAAGSRMCAECRREAGK